MLDLMRMLQSECASSVEVRLRNIFPKDEVKLQLFLKWLFGKNAKKRQGKAVIFGEK